VSIHASIRFHQDKTTRAAVHAIRDSRFVAALARVCARSCPRPGPGHPRLLAPIKCGRTRLPQAATATTFPNLSCRLSSSSSSPARSKTSVAAAATPATEDDLPGRSPQRSRHHRYVRTIGAAWKSGTQIGLSGFGFVRSISLGVSLGVLNCSRVVNFSLWFQAMSSPSASSCPQCRHSSIGPGSSGWFFF
jgi:hypothetical protein